MRTHNDEYGLRLALLLGGMAEHGAGNVGAASRMMDEAVDIARSFGQDRELAVALQTYATVLLGRDQDAKVHAMVRESLEALRRDPSFLFIARAIDLFAVGLVDDEPERGARAIGVALTMRRHIGANRFEHDEVLMNGVIARIREKLGDTTYEQSLADGMRVQPSDAIDAVLGTAAAVPEAGGSPETPPAARAKEAAEDAPRVDETVRADFGARADLATRADLTVRALGPLEVWVRGRRIEAWPYAKPKELLVYLVMHPQGRTRAEIGAELWPHASAAQVRNSFHVTVHHVRKALGHADWLVLAGERYRIAPDVSVDLDVTAFQQQVRDALALTGQKAIDALRSALALYRDHFLAGEQAGPWRDDVQDRLRARFCDAGLRLGELLDDSGDLDAASAAYENVIACEPLHEAAHRGLLLTLTRAGRRAHALRHFDRLTAVLRELELEPEEETVALRERIRAADIVMESGAGSASV
jgi:DNA-binding SARP family transcriptional activator